MSGTFCFLNSILQVRLFLLLSTCQLLIADRVENSIMSSIRAIPQVLASSPRFLEYSYSILASSSTLPGPPPQSNVTSTLLPFLLTLVTPSPSPYPRPLRPTALVEALRLSDTFAKAGMFGRLREQQDAHELWALLSDAVEEEDKLVRNLTRSQRAGLRTFLAAGGEERGGEGEPWMGRMAYRRACRICGYSEGIRLMQSGEVSLSLPERTVSLEFSLCRSRGLRRKLTSLWTSLLARLPH